MSVAVDEKRRAGRLACEHLTCALGEVVDVSASGLKVATRSWGAMRPGDTVRLTLKTKSSAVTVETMVTWVRRVGMRKRQVGLHFLNVDERARRQLWAMACAGAREKNNAGQPYGSPVPSKMDWQDVVSILNSVN